jgi:hypothetical protein
VAYLFAVDAAGGAVTDSNLFVPVVLVAFADVIVARVGSTAHIALDCVSLEGAGGHSGFVSKVVTSCTLEEGWTGFKLADDDLGSEHA